MQPLEAIEVSRARTDRRILEVEAKPWPEILKRQTVTDLETLHRQFIAQMHRLERRPPLELE